MTEWKPDLLGPGYESTTLPLHPDEEGEVVATLVRAVPDLPHGAEHTPRFAFLAIHGWNDYFYQVELAEQVMAAGGQFYAIDLRKYGRSHREWQSWGYTSNLSVYDDDLHAALDVIHDAHGYSIPLVLYGHSTGGLTAALWTHRHQGVLAGLVLNSPWLELQGSTMVREISQPVIDALARMTPYTALPVADNGFYARLLTGWKTDEEAAEVSMKGIVDPFYTTGWNPDPKYRHVPTFPIRAGWLGAILNGHDEVEEGLDIRCPILVLTSGKSIFDDDWNADMRGADIVLDVEQIWKRVPTLGRATTLIKVDDAIHDVFLSRESARNEAFFEMRRWLDTYVCQD